MEIHPGLTRQLQRGQRADINLFSVFCKLRCVRNAISAALACMLMIPICFAQGNPSPTTSSATTMQVSAISSVELWLAYAIIAFGFVVLCMQFILLRGAKHSEPEDVLRLFTVTIIIIGTLALIAIGYSSQQIAPALGLFGTILGYLLGKSDERSRARRSQAPGDTESTPQEASQP